jgi:YesN/AraC family two-component response regulator
MELQQLLNHKEISILLYNGNLKGAIEIGHQKVLKLKSEKNTNLFAAFLHSLNFGIYNYILLMDGVSLHQSCKKNMDLIKFPLRYTELNTTMETIITTYILSMEYASERYSNPHVRNSIKFILAHLGEPLSLNQICEHVNLNKSYLCVLFKKHTSYGLCEYIEMKRLKVAKSLLKETDLRIYIISELCGFSSLSYFCTVFKKSIGTTPQLFRNSS